MKSTFLILAAVMIANSGCASREDPESDESPLIGQWVVVKELSQDGVETNSPGESVYTFRGDGSGLYQIFRRQGFRTKEADSQSFAYILSNTTLRMKGVWVGRVPALDDGRNWHFVTTHLTYEADLEGDSLHLKEVNRTRKAEAGYMTQSSGSVYLLKKQ